MKLKSIVPAALTAALFMSGLTSHAFAGEEDRCAMIGATGAEYELCNTYCEIMDCGGQKPKASKEACRELGLKYFALTAETTFPPCGPFFKSVKQVETEPGHKGALLTYGMVFDVWYFGYLDGRGQSGIERGADTACEAKFQVCVAFADQEEAVIATFKGKRTENEVREACTNFKASNKLTCSISACVDRRMKSPGGPLSKSCE